MELKNQFIDVDAVTGILHRKDFIADVPSIQFAFSKSNKKYLGQADVNGQHPFLVLTKQDLDDQHIVYEGCWIQTDRGTTGRYAEKSIPVTLFKPSKIQLKWDNVDSRQLIVHNPFERFMACNFLRSVCEHMPQKMANVQRYYDYWCTSNNRS